MENYENIGLKKGEKVLKQIIPNPAEFFLHYIFGGALCFLYGIGIIYILLIEVDRRKTKYYITTERVIYEHTFLGNNVSSVNYSKIQDLHLKQNFLEKSFEIGNIEINTAGSNKKELKLKGIKKPVKIKNIIENQY
ncbi:PH domain-containing protein [archaeon]|jgi:uncharacterized membrane protein YdbT with pleckstrin-like domain|nr:PH domain-containing protein [archaeon]